jgi:TetR/AcrR family transcriptional regulator
MHVVTKEKTTVFNAWAKAGKMDPVNPIHLFVLLWSSTQFYADFETWVTNAMGSRRVSAANFADAEALITHVVLKGLGVA